METSDSLPPFDNESFAEGKRSLWRTLGTHPWPLVIGGGIAALVVVLAALVLR